MTTPLTKPTTIVEPFANSGSKNTIPVTASTTPGLASLDTGFPPLTMTPVAQGGVPPSGLDFNGIFNWITQHTAWLNAGGQYTFDAALAAFIGGYPVGMVLQSNDGRSSYVNVQSGNSADFNTDSAQIGVTWLPYGGDAVSSNSTVTIATTGGTTVLTGDQAAKRIIKVTGTLTSNANIVLPNTYSKTWTVQNATTGAYAVNVTPSGGTSVPVSQGSSDAVYSDGATMRYAQTDATTQPLGDNSTKLVNTACLTAAIAAALVNTALTGTPTAPTAPQNTNNTQIATTEYADRSSAAIGVGSVPQYKNSSFTGGPTGLYWVDTSAGALTMTLPDPPLNQNPIEIKDLRGTFSVNPLTINPGTKTILATSGNLIDNIAGHVFAMWYDGSTWRIQ